MKPRFWAGWSRQVEYHPAEILVLTCGRNPVGGQCMVGSLTGAVAS